MSQHCLASQPHSSCSRIILGYLSLHMHGPTLGQGLAGNRTNVWGVTVWHSCLLWCPNHRFGLFWQPLQLSKLATLCSAPATAVRKFPIGRGQREIGGITSRVFSLLGITIFAPCCPKLKRNCLVSPSNYIVVSSGKVTLVVTSPSWSQEWNLDEMPLLKQWMCSFPSPSVRSIVWEGQQDTFIILLQIQEINSPVHQIRYLTGTTVILIFCR